MLRRRTPSGSDLPDDDHASAATRRLRRSSANADRAADAGGFYNHPLTATWTGVDATSGIASCTSTPYSGPDGTGISLTGTCKDKAGNVSAPVPFVFNYDATPPALTAVTAMPRRRRRAARVAGVGGGEGDGHAQSGRRAGGAEPTSSTTARATGSPTPG